MSIQLDANLNIVGSHHDLHSTLTAVRAWRGSQFVIDREGDEQADREGQASDHQQTASVHSSPSRQHRVGWLPRRLDFREEAV
jgi:hypothetical protein